MNERVRLAVDIFAKRTRAVYGARFAGFYLFGSQARGDQHAESDVDVAVILEGDGWNLAREKMRLGDIAYDISLETDVSIDAWPVSQQQWDAPISRRTSFFLIGARQHAIALEVGP